MNQTLKQLNKAYTKRFKQLTKSILTVNNSGLLLFVEHLRYLRDIQILVGNSIEGNSSLTTLNAALAEFEAYQNSQNDFHWKNFCSLIKLNMKEWLTINDSV